MSENRPRKSRTAYAGAAGSVALALLVTLVLPVWEKSSFLLVVAAVMLSSLGGGLGPGLFATVLGVVGSVALLMGRTGSPGLHHAGDIARLVVLACVGVSIAAAAEAGRRAVRERERLLAGEREARAAAEDAREALRESEARKGAILEAALDSIITIDAGGRIVELNATAEKTFGYTRAEMLGQLLADLIIPPAQRDRHRRGLEHYLATGAAPVLGRRIEMTARRSDGTEFPVELAVTRIQSDGPPLFTGHLRDISARKRAEAEREELLSSERAARADIDAERRRFAFLAEA